MDVPDEKGETKSQTPVVGMAIDLLDKNSPERERLDLEKSVIAGAIPSRAKEMLIGYKLADSLGIQLGDTVTLLGQNFDGGMATDNYQVVGFVKFGLAAVATLVLPIEPAPTSGLIRSIALPGSGMWVISTPAKMAQ